MSLNTSNIRADFPIFRRKINNNPLIYFDNAATTQKPRQVIESIKNFYENHNANVHRAIHTLSQEATELYENAREKIAQFINSKSSEEIIFSRGTTEAINLIAYSWGLKNLKKNDEILVSEMEHHSNIVPWELISKRNECVVKYARVNNDGTLNFEDFKNKISKKTKIVSISHVSNVVGIVNEIKKIGKIAHENNSLILVDGAQSVPHMKVDVRDLDIDFLAFSGHKMLGPTGIGALYCKKEHYENMDPFQGGGEMIKEVNFNMKTQHSECVWNEPPWKFEAGTPNICGSIGFMEAIKYLDQIGMNKVWNHEKKLTRYTFDCLQEHKKITIHGSLDVSLKCGIIPFSVQGLSSHDVALFADNFGIMIRSGYHCAQPLHQVFNLRSSARASFYIYNTCEEIDRFVEVLK
ncbi:cysteine desulfurase, partial [Candidatus Bathyarchaeota archaeon]|nr:cysteine desulfurase [Candidatus Bathyarchaeota archaeon]